MKKRLLLRHLSVLLLLLCNISVFADDLITKQVVINVESPGCLPNKMGNTKKYQITNLKLVGELNGTDIRFIREMAGAPSNTLEPLGIGGNLKILDLGEAKIVRGGSSYTTDSSDEVYTNDNVIGKSMFYGCVGIEKLILPSGVIAIGTGAFSCCYSLTDLEIPKGVTSIYNGAFYECRGLQKIIIPSSITFVSSDAFSKCYNLKDVRYYIYDSLEEYLEKKHPRIFVNRKVSYYIKGMEITNLEIPYNVVTIGDNAFTGCSDLKSLTFSSEVSSIGRNAFEGCNGLTSLTFPSTVPSIDECAFKGCESLSNLVLPSNIASISKSAFEGCKGLTNLTFPSTVTSIDECAFKGCEDLSSLVLPSNITSISKSAFDGCKGLTNLTFPSTVTSIDECAFKGCEGLSSLVLPSNITTIGKSAFEGCVALIALTLPSTVTSIGENAFSNCSALASIYSNIPNPQNISSKVFDGVNKQKCILYVPKDTYLRYWLADGWGDFENIVEYDVTGIDKTMVPSDVNEVSRYSVNGQRLTAPTKGVNIVKYSDGNVRKEIVK